MTKTKNPGSAMVPIDSGGFVLYQTDDGGARIEVRLENETVWLSQQQLAELFVTDRTSITKHIKEIYANGELDASATSAKFAQVRREGERTVNREIVHYNLDLCISVGYRVNSKRGTQFRMWATRVLREHLVKGYTVNETRLKELNQAIRLIAAVAERRALTGDEAAALLRVVADYSYALDVLDDYDHQRIEVTAATTAQAVAVDYEEALAMIERMRVQFGGSALFGREKDRGLAGSLAAVMQTAGGQDAYPSIEEKAANLLYFLVKNHHFVDGNKRIAAALFLWFLEKNGLLYRPDGGKRVADNALVAITLLIAESRPAEKLVLTRVVANLVNGKNQ